MSPSFILRHGESASCSDIPIMDMEEFRSVFLEELSRGRIAAFFGKPNGDSVRLLAVMACPDHAVFSVFAADVKEEYPALTPDCNAAHGFEREIAEQWGIRPVGHPSLKPVRRTEPSVTNFFQVRGDEIHEVGVGPVHAGVIEPGHFRFQCHGEEVLHLEISLGYQHRGVERALIGGPALRTIHYMETLAGDTSIGHATAYAHAVETLATASIPARALAIRGIALELERLANHTGDLGALAQDIGFLPTASYCGRLRGDFLNMTALICGSRFGRGLIRPGGALFDITDEMMVELETRLNRADEEVRDAVELLWNSASVLARFEETGKLGRETAQALGLVGPAARSCGLMRDARHEFPSGIFRFSHIPVSTWDSGDVFARAYVRWLEIQRSLTFIRDGLRDLPGGPALAPLGPLAPNQFAVSMVEGWRGEICHVAMTDENGRFSHYKVVDPSFHNWMGLSLALRDQQISDFPLCNKSFNLSYCGHDL